MSTSKVKFASAKDDATREEADEECCGIFLLKNILFLFNFLLLLSGLAILSVGLWTVFDKHSYVAVLATTIYEATTYLLVLTGALIVVVVFGLGCCGAWRENRLCLTIYAIFLIVIFVLEAICGTLAYFYEARIHEELVDNLNQTMATSYRRDISITQSIDSMQLTFKCCGASSYMDWVKVPDSCCKTPSNTCTDKSQHPSNINYKGCVESLADFLRPHLIVLGAVGLGLCCLQIFGVIVSCWLIKKIKDKKEAEQNHWR